MDIGIDTNSSLIYKGSGLWGHAIWPSPIVLQLVIAKYTDQVVEPAPQGNLAPNSFIFVEDTYDPVSRIRRGQIYQAGNTQPERWCVYPHPAIPSEQADVNNAGILNKSLYTFYSFRLLLLLKHEEIHQSLFVLGSENGFSLWSLINAETTASNEELITLKARQTIGALPTLNYNKVISVKGEQLIDEIERLSEDIHSAGPESVIDRSREAARAAMALYLQSTNRKQGLDIGKLISVFDSLEGNDKRHIVCSAANIVAKLHARGKSAEKEKRPLRPIDEQDAELAIMCVGLILCDLGFADWGP